MKKETIFHLHHELVVEKGRMPMMSDEHMSHFSRQMRAWKHEGGGRPMPPVPMTPTLDVSWFSPRLGTVLRTEIIPLN